MQMRVSILKITYKLTPLDAMPIKKVSMTSLLETVMQNQQKSDFSLKLLYTMPYALSLKTVWKLELVSKELNHFGVIAGLFRQIGGHSSGFVLFCS